MTCESLRAQFPEPGKDEKDKKDPLSDIIEKGEDGKSFELQSDIKEEHKKYLNQAAKEAAVLGKLAFRSVRDGEIQVDELAKAIITNTAEATIETFAKRLEPGSKSKRKDEYARRKTVPEKALKSKNKK